MCDEWTEADDAVEEVREIRRRIWAQFDNDPRKLLAHHIELCKRLPPERFAPPRRREDGKSAA
jgi:hypothetical protein